MSWKVSFSLDSGTPKEKFLRAEKFRLTNFLFVLFCRNHTRILFHESSCIPFGQSLDIAIECHSNSGGFREREREMGINLIEGKLTSLSLVVSFVDLIPGNQIPAHNIMRNNTQNPDSFQLLYLWLQFPCQSDEDRYNMMK